VAAPPLTPPPTPPPPGRARARAWVRPAPPWERSRNHLLWLLAAAALLGLQLVILGLVFPALLPEPDRLKTRPVQFIVTPPEEPVPPEELTRPEPELDGQLVDTPPPVEEERPDDSEYLAEHDNKVEEETRTERYRVNPEVLAPEFSEADEVKVEEAMDLNVTEQSTGAQVGNERFDPDKDGPMAALPSQFRLTNRDGMQAPVMASSRSAALSGAPNNDLLREKIGKATQLNTRELVGATYLNHIRRLVNFYWSQNLDNLPSSVLLARPSYTSVVDVILDSDGAVVAMNLTQPCGSPELDEAVLQAFRLAGPFPNPPRQLIEADGKIYLPTMSFTVELGRARPVFMGVDPRAGTQFPGIQKAPR
jgi:TonB family protein